MKKLVLLTALIFTVFAVINNFSPAAYYLEETTGKGTLPFRYGYLLTKKPEEKIALPIRNIRAKQITDTWQAPRSGERLHQGQDIFAPKGTLVYSATAGYVWRVGENSLGGNTISVVGAGGRIYYYAHLDKYAPNLKAGDFVTPETVLGFVGTSGNAAGTPPHLHFGVYTANGAINPLLLFD